MAETAKTTKKPAKKATGTSYKGFTKEERAAMKERAAELKSAASESEVVAKIEEMPEPDRGIAERVHAIIRATAPQLTPRLWYGMPAYAKDGQIVCFLQPAAKFKTRYSTLGFNDAARLDDGSMWPTAFALTKLTKADEARLAELIKQAVS